MSEKQKPKFARVISGRLVLPRETRKALFAGDLPHITFYGKRPCPVEPGARFQLGPHRVLEVKSIVRDGSMNHGLRYELYNSTPRPRLLRRSPHAVDFDAIRDSYDRYGMPEAPTPDLIEQAREEGAYTTSAKYALGDVGEAVGDDFLKRDRLKREVDMRNAQMQAQQRQRQAVLASETELLRARVGGRVGRVRVLEAKRKQQSRRLDNAA